MNQDLMSLFHNDEKMYMLFMTDPFICSGIRYCQKRQLSTQETLVELVKILAEQNKNLNDRLIYEMQHKTNQIYINKDSII